MKIKIKYIGLLFGMIGFLNMNSLNASELKFPITVTDGNTSQILTIGWADSCTDGFDSDMDLLAPPLPPSGAFGCILQIDVNQFYTDIRDNQATEKIFTMKYQPGAGRSIVLHWDKTALDSVESCDIIDPVTGDLFKLKMKTADSLQVASSQYITNSLIIKAKPLSYSPPENNAPIVKKPINDHSKIVNFSTYVVADLKDVFDDSDSDELTFSSSTDGNTKAEIQSSILKLSSIQDFVGKSTIIVTASDNKASVSDTFVVTVKPEQKPDSFSFQILVSDGNNHQKVTMGFNENATDDFDSELDILSPPLPPSGGFGALLEWGTNQFYRDIRNFADSTAFNMKYQPASGKNLTLSWSLDSLSADDEYDYFLVDNVTGNLFVRDMKKVGFLEISEGSYIAKSAKIWVVKHDYETEREQFIQNTVANAFILDQNYPNPFNSSTRIQFQLTKPNIVQLKIYNNNGQEIRSLIYQHLQPGYYSVTWDGLDQKNQAVSSGLYFYKIISGQFMATRKLIMLR